MAKKPLAKNIKDEMVKVLDPNFVIKVFNQKLKDHYQDFLGIEKIFLTPYKKHLGLTSAVFVIEYKITYRTKNDQRKTIEIFVSAHSDKSRQGAYQKNLFLYNYGFAEGKYKVTRPLFYLDKQRGHFYQASIGKRLFSFFTENPQADLEPAFSLLTGWLKKLHNCQYQQADFVWPEFSIDKMIPRPSAFINDFYQNNKIEGELAEKIYQGVLKMEKDYAKKIKKSLIYGDNHPENVIIESLATDHLEMIDFTDVALGDPMMDLGTFLQQFDFMGHNFISRDRMNNYKIFLIENYFGQKIEAIDVVWLNRINLYQSWTALRSSVFLFYMKDRQNPIMDLLLDGTKYLDFALNNKRSINLS